MFVSPIRVLTVDLGSTFNDALSLAREANNAGAGWVSLVLDLEERTGARFNNSGLSTSSETWKKCDDKKGARHQRTAAERSERRHNLKFLLHYESWRSVTRSIS
jgi:hypothetical protein